MSRHNLFCFSSRRRHTRCGRDWSSDVCSSDLFYMTTAHATQECEVCMRFNEHSNCAKAVGRTVDQATEGAHTTACGPLASGMNEQIACQRTPPVRVQCRIRSPSDERRRETASRTN